MSLSGTAVPSGPSSSSAQATAQPQAQQQVPPSNLGANQQIAAAQPTNGAAAIPQFSPSTEQILRRIHANGGVQPALQAAREQVLQQMVTTQNVSAPTQPPPPRRGSSRGRGRAGGSSSTRVEKPRRESAAAAATGSPTTPARGRGSGRARGGGRGGRRKRVKKEEDEHDDEEETSDVRSPLLVVALRPPSVLPADRPSTSSIQPAPKRSHLSRRRPSRAGPSTGLHSMTRLRRRRLDDAARIGAWPKRLSVGSVNEGIARRGT